MGKKSNPDFLKEERLLARALQNVFNPIGEQPSITVKQAAERTKAAESTNYHWGEKGKIPGWALLKIAKLAAEHGDFSLLNMAIPKGYCITPIEVVEINGSLDDELAEATEVLGETSKNFKNDDLRGAKRQLNALRQVANKIETEINAKEGRS